MTGAAKSPCDTIKFPGCANTCKAVSSTQKVCTYREHRHCGLGAAHGEMVDAGVKDIVYFLDPHITASSGGYKEILDYSSPRAKASCEASSRDLLDIDLSLRRPHPPLVRGRGRRPQRRQLRA